MKAAAWLLVVALAACGGDADVAGNSTVSLTNGNSDCSQIQGCLTYRDFNGTRPPT